MNTLKIGLLLTAITALFVVTGRAIGGQSGMVIALVLAVVMNFGSYWFSDKIVLGMSGARQVSIQEAPALYHMTEELTMRAGLPMPKLYVVNDPQPNAFATGRNPQNSAIAVNSGLLEILDRREVEGVLAHELGHIQNRDTLIMTIYRYRRRRNYDAGADGPLRCDVRRNAPQRPRRRQPNRRAHSLFSWRRSRQC